MVRGCRSTSYSMSMAKVFGARLVAVVMSGTGADGSGGLKAVKAKGALVIAQEIAEADYDGMPRSAIATGAVDHVLPAAKIAAALVERERGVTPTPTPRNLVPTIRLAIYCRDRNLLRTKTVHDFSLYKHGTLERRVDAAWPWPGFRLRQDYLALLRATARNSNNSLVIC